MTSYSAAVCLHPNIFLYNNKYHETTYIFSFFFYRLEKSRSHSSEETETNRRQLPKKPQRQNNIRDDREPTPDYDSTGDKSTDKSPLATSPIKKSPNQLEQSGGSSDNQTRGKKKNHTKN